MTEAAMSAMSAMSAILAVGAQATSPVPPTAEQAARFQALLQADPALELARYDVPLAPPLTIDSQMQPLASYAADVSEQMRAQLQPSQALDIDAQLWPELYSLQQITRQTQAMNVTSMQMQLLGKGVQLLNDSVQALYQRV